MNTTEGNELIADFMFAQHLPTGKYILDNNARVDATEMKFHESWDWLMPVVEKIETLVHDSNTHSSPTISGRWYAHSIEFYNYKKGSFDRDYIIKCQSDYSNGESKISTYYRAVIEFIKWYNQNKEL